VSRFEEQVANDAEAINNAVLLRTLRQVLDAPYFHVLPKETWIASLGALIKVRLYATLKSNNEFQQRMGIFWQAGETEENRSSIKAYYREFITNIALGVVLDTIRLHHPQFHFQELDNDFQSS
jgi:hypothetical protein